jgi:2-polyprenyl-3-methyl-5-hydroxy-6-metoxy-1,4-benzoquinol methylase
VDGGEARHNGSVDAYLAAREPVDLLARTWTTLTAAQSRLHEVREREHRNYDGGDAGHQWDEGLVRRHAVNYAVAVDAARAVDLPGSLLDVGAGAGAFSVWAADALDRPLVIVDRDAGHRDLAARAFPQAAVHAEVVEVPPAPVVLSMEVIEHVPREQQEPFVRSLGQAVVPGGLLAMSTPDESGYWRGWSGYAPHVATLDATRLAALLQRLLEGWSVEVLRIGGPGFDLSRVGRYGVPVANRVWNALDSHVPALAHEVSYRVNQIGKRRPAPAAPDPSQFTVQPATRGAGTGLVALARRPA